MAQRLLALLWKWERQYRVVIRSLRWSTENIMSSGQYTDLGELYHNGVFIALYSSHLQRDAVEFFSHSNDSVPVENRVLKQSKQV